MASYPPWKRSLEYVCRGCRTVYGDDGVNELGLSSYCPTCFQKGKRYRLQLERLQWISTSHWYNPLSWLSGYWIDEKGEIWNSY